MPRFIPNQAMRGLAARVSTFALLVALAASASARVAPEDRTGDEALELRRTHSTTHREADGSYTARFSARPIHYRDASGVYLPIATEVLALAAADDEWQLTNTTNTMKTSFARERAAVRAIGDHVWLEYEIVGLDYVQDDERESLHAAKVRTPPIAEGPSVMYAGIFPQADLALTVSEGRLRQEVILTAPPAKPATLDASRAALALREIVRLAPGALLLDELGRAITTSRRVEGRMQVRGSGPESIWIDRPFVRDSSDAPPQAGEFTVLFQQSDETSGLVFILQSTVEYSWLASPERQYPVILDPDLIQQPDAAGGKDSQVWTTGVTMQLGTSDRILQNWSGGGILDSDGMIEFDLTAIPSGSVVNTATLEVFQNNGGAEPNPIGPFLNLGAWDEMTVTWMNSPPFAATPTDTYPAGVGGPAFHSWNVTVDAQDMVNNPTTNFGWRISADGPGDSTFVVDIRSSDHTTPTERPELAVNYDIGGVEILQVDATDTTVVAGLGGYPVTMTVDNLGMNALSITTSALTFTGSADRTSEYTVTPDPGNPTTIPPMGQVVLTYSVDVMLGATEETITIDGSISADDATLMVTFMDADSTITDTWDVIACSAPLCGDCNGDLVLSILDALVAAQHSAVLITLMGIDFSNCNVIGTLEPFPGAVVDILDALTLAQAAAGLPVALMCC